MVSDWAVEIGNLTNLRAVSDHFRNISAGRYNIIHAVLPFHRPYAISAGCFSSVTPCRVLSTSTEYNIIHAALLFHWPYAISAGCFSSVTPCRVLSTSTEYNIIHAALPFHRPYAISACFIKPDRKLPRLFADAGTWFRNETLVSAASATKRECAGGSVPSGDLPAVFFIIYSDYRISAFWYFLFRFGLFLSAPRSCNGCCRP